MKFILITCLAIFFLSCNKLKITKIEFDSRDYEFNAEIINTLEQSGEVGFSARRFSFVSEHQKLLKTLETGDSIKNPINDSLWTQIQHKFEQINANEFLIEKAKEYDIVMFNENHNLPRHRNFVTSMLSELYGQGYRFLALEALGMLGDGTMFDKELQQRGYPLKHSGFYLKEPEFSMLIRKASELGFEIIGYDEGSSYGYSGGEREERGAENILRQINQSDIKGKLIVHCGWDHLREGSSGTYWEHALAERLKQKTGNDILSINQTEYNERLNRKYENPLMQRLTNEESIVLLDKEGESIDLLENKDWYDVFLFHPRTKFKFGIPDWILEEGDVKNIDLSKVDINYPCKLFVFDKEDDVLKASPIYVKEIDSKESKLVIPTRGMKVKLVFTNKKESILLE